DVGVNSDHRAVLRRNRSAASSRTASFISSMVTCRPIGGTIGMKSSSRLVLARTVSTPFSSFHRSGVPSLIPRASRNSLGMVVWPLLVTVDWSRIVTCSFIFDPLFLTNYNSKEYAPEQGLTAQFPEPQPDQLVGGQLLTLASD